MKTFPTLSPEITESLKKWQDTGVELEAIAAALIRKGFSREVRRGGYVLRLSECSCDYMYLVTDHWVCNCPHPGTVRLVDWEGHPRTASAEDILSIPEKYLYWPKQETPTKRLGAFNYEKYLEGYKAITREGVLVREVVCFQDERATWPPGLWQTKYLLLDIKKSLLKPGSSLLKALAGQ